MNLKNTIGQMFAKKTGPEQPIARPDDPRFWTYWSLDGIDLEHSGNKTPAISSPGQQLKEYRGWIYALCNRISNDLISFDRVLQKKRGDQWEDATDAKALDFLKRIEEPFKYGTDEDLFKIMSVALNLTGRANAQIRTVGGSGVVLDGIHPISPEYINYHVDDFGILDYWEYQNKKTVRLSPEQIFYAHYMNPNDIYSPLSPVAAVAAGISLYSEAMNYNYRWMKNDTQASAYASPRAGIDAIDQKVVDKLKEWARKQVGKIGGIEILPVGMDITSRAAGVRGMQFGEDFKMLSQEMANAYGYMLFLLTGEGINRSVMEVGLYVTRESCIRPHAKIIEAAFNQQIVRRFLGPDYWYSFVIPEIKFSEDTAKILAADLQYNIRSREEIREDQGLNPEFEGTEPNPKVQTSYQQPGFQPEPNQPVEPTKTIKLLPAKPMILKSSFKAEERYFEWKAFDTLATAIQSPFADSIMRSFKKQGKNYIQRIKQAYEAGEPITAEMFDQEFAKTDLTKVSMPHIKNAGLRGYNNGRRLARSRGEYNETTIRDAFLTQRATLMAAQTTETTFQKLAALVAKGAPSHKKDASVVITLEEFIKEVDDLFNGFDSRAVLGAETQTVGVLNWGTQEGYRDSNVAGKEWLSQQDGRVRGPNSDPPSEFNHDLDGVVIPLGAKFNTGPESIEYPGDPSGAPGNICNCRCTVLPAF